VLLIFKLEKISSTRFFVFKLSEEKRNIKQQSEEREREEEKEKLRKKIIHWISSEKVHNFIISSYIEEVMSC